MIADSISISGNELTALLGTAALLAAVCFSAGLIVGLLLRAAPAQLAAGFLLKSMKPFRRGDMISVGSETGTVASIRWHSTEIVLPNNATLFVPNSELLGSRIVNHTAKETRRFDIRVGIAHSCDLEAAADIIKEALSSDPRTLKEPPPCVAIAESDLKGLALISQAWAPATEYRQVRSDTTQSIHRLLAAEGIRMHGARVESHPCGHEACDPLLSSSN